VPSMSLHLSNAADDFSEPLVDWLDAVAKDIIPISCGFRGSPAISMMKNGHSYLIQLRGSISLDL
jgi:hypothetical protein